MTGQHIDARGHAVPAFNLINGQEVAYTSTAGAIATAITAGCKMVLVWCSTDAYVRIATAAADAANTDIHMPAGVPMFLPVLHAASKVAAKRMTADGTLHVNECW